MYEVHPILLRGPWTQGYALDRQVLRSIYTGDNEFGHPTFDTTRTEIGEAMYQLKYRSNRDILPEIVETASAFVRSYYTNDVTIDDIVSVLPSDESRSSQPVYCICEGMAESLGLIYSYEYVVKVTQTPQMKNTPIEEREQILSDAFEVRNEAHIQSLNSVLLVDDLFQTGTTAKYITNVLKSVNSKLSVMLLTMTKTKDV